MLSNIPKIMHFYWDKSNMSYLQYMTIISFNKFHPEWEIIIHEPKKKFDGITWNTDEQRIKYEGKNYYEQLKNLSFIKFNEIDFNEIGFREDVPEIFKSDYLRWYLLSTIGGGWSDMDIIYLRSIYTLTHKPIDTLICFGKYKHIIGFFLSVPHNPFFGKIFYASKLKFNINEYQSIGANLLNSLYPDIKNIYHQMPNIKLCNLPMDSFYLFDHLNVDKIFESNNIKSIKNDTVGLHWYNGSDIAKNFNNNYDPDNEEINNTITEILKKIK